MRKLFKYLLKLGDQVENMFIDTTFEDNKKTMGYSCDKGYSSKKDFFYTWFYNYHWRLKDYNEYLKRLTKNEKTLSIGCGWCANELCLAENGRRL